MPDPRRSLPSIDALLRTEPARRAASRFGRPVVRQAVREVLDEARRAVARGETPASAEGLLAAAVSLAARTAFGLTPVINATGVVLHTNLGRAPLPEVAARAAARAGRSYTDLEVDRLSGRRGRRGDRAERMLTALTEAEAALVVNNNAAALLLALAALAPRKEVLVSRGELIEIGGEFRLPDILAASGAKLVEVGTTNRTRPEDFRRALSPKTGLILAVHPSNYRVVGFQESPGIAKLAEIAREADIPLLHDIGSGLLAPRRGVPADEPSASGSLRAGADLVCFSGDKLLGGPQSGVLAGSRALVERLRRHPIARAVRVDKMTVAALEAVLQVHARGEPEELPVWRALTARPSAMRARAARLAAELPSATVRKAAASAGGGSLPGWEIPSIEVRVPAARPGRLAARLRAGRPAVFCRVDDDSVALDLSTVDPAEDDRLLRAVRYAISQEG